MNGKEPYETGEITEIHVWDVALTEEECVSLHDNTNVSSVKPVHLIISDGLSLDRLTIEE